MEITYQTLTKYTSPWAKITYVSEFGDKPADKVVAKGYILTSEDLPSLSEEGYRFLGWDKTSGTIVNADITITASWEPSSWETIWSGNINTETMEKADTKVCNIDITKPLRITLEKYPFSTDIYSEAVARYYKNGVELDWWPGMPLTVNITDTDPEALFNYLVTEYFKSGHDVIGRVYMTITRRSNELHIVVSGDRVWYGETPPSMAITKVEQFI